MSQPASVTKIPRKDIHAHRLLILDFGSQYTQLIARRVRERGVYSEIHPWDMDDDAIAAFRPSGIILSGGPESVNLEDPPRVSRTVFELGVPVLGICYGMQSMAAPAATARRGARPECSPPPWARADFRRAGQCAQRVSALARKEKRSCTPALTAWSVT